MKEGQILKQVLVDNEITIKSLAEALGKSEKTIYGWMSKAVLPKEILIICHFYVHLPLAKFANSRDTTEFYSSRKKRRESIGTKLFVADGNTKREFDDYFKEGEDKVMTAQRSISIYDYLAKAMNPDQDDKGSYSTRLEKYFGRLEDYISQNHNIEYRRIISLPSEIKTRLTLDRSLVAVLKIIPPTLFKHFCRCLNSDGNIQLFVLSRPTKFYSFALVDSDKLLLEYDRYDPNRVSHLDLMYSLEKQGQDDPIINQSIALFEKKFENLYSTGMNDFPPIWRIGKAMWQKCTQVACSELERDIEEKKKKRESILNGDVNDHNILTSENGEILDQSESLIIEDDLEKFKDLTFAIRDLDKRLSWMEKKLHIQKECIARLK